MNESMIASVESGVDMMYCEKIIGNTANDVNMVDICCASLAFVVIDETHAIDTENRKYPSKKYMKARSVMYEKLIPLRNELNDVNWSTRAAMIIHMRICMSPTSPYPRTFPLSRLSTEIDERSISPVFVSFSSAIPSMR